ncbi:hypothetical protein [Arthrobacter pigmenti]
MREQSWSREAATWVPTQQTDQHLRDQLSLTDVVVLPINSK